MGFRNIIMRTCHTSEPQGRGFPGGPLVENRPSHAGEEDSIHGQGTEKLRSHMLQGN